MIAVILAGGKGSRLNGFSETVPKPLVRIGEYPILYHVMMIFSKQGVKDFIILTGYKGSLISEYFYNFVPNLNNFTVNLRTGIHRNNSNIEPPDWNVTILSSGEETMTGGRLLRAQSLLRNESNFFFTYGDGLANINLKKLVDHHLKNKLIATVSAVNQPSRFGSLEIRDDLVTDFREKPSKDNFINGGFFCFSNKIFDYLENDSTVLEDTPLTTLADEGQLSAYKHFGFWQCMDTPRDVELLQQLSRENPSPWEILDNFN
jgi:glucose-1-phosphate cytidylyltransferase